MEIRRGREGFFLLLRPGCPPPKGKEPPRRRQARGEEECSLCEVSGDKRGLEENERVAPQGMRAATGWKRSLDWGVVMAAAIAALSCAGASARGGMRSGAAWSGLPAGGVAHGYYVDCSQARNGTGTEARPWNSIAAANAQSYGAGDTIFFKRGTTCRGMFSPRGAGSAGRPITVTDYGWGARPVMDGGSANAAVILLTNQSYWTFENLKLLHGQTWGLLARAQNGATVTGLTIRDLSVTEATSVATRRAQSGEIGLLTDGADSATINDVNISNVTVGDTKTGEGIFVRAGYQRGMQGAKGKNISITDARVSNVYGDGILVTDGENITIRHDVVTESGECRNCTGSTPGALWVWNSVDAVMSWNESYHNTSWAGDGGGMDIDFWNRNVIVEDNYIHDNKGYCVSVFGAGHQTTVNSVIRFNVCVNNNAARNSVNKGDFLLSTWNGGSLNGVRIYNNTCYWTAKPAGDYELTDNHAVFKGTDADLFMNNLVYTPLKTPYLIMAAGPMKVNHNLYYGPNATQYGYEYDGRTYTSLAEYERGSGQGSGSRIADPLLPQPGYDVAKVWPRTQFRPQAGSRARDAGADVCAGIGGCSMGRSDVAGHRLPANGYWMGAVE